MKNNSLAKTEQQIQPLKKRVEIYAQIGKNMLSNQFQQNNPTIQTKLVDILGKFYVRIERERITSKIKFGVNGEIEKSQDFLQDFFRHLKKSSIKGYFFIGIYTPIFKEIAKVEFTQLQRLQLIGCHIKSLQPLTWLNAPNFKSIFLRSNYITSLKPLQKTCFHKFTSIDIDRNYFNDYFSLCRMMTVNYDPAKNNKLFIFITESNGLTPDITFILKMQNVQTSLVGEKNTTGSYIKQPRLIDAVHRFQVHFYSSSKQIDKKTN